MTTRYTDAQGRTWERYTDPLAPEPANPYRWTSGCVVEAPTQVKTEIDNRRAV